MMIDRQLLRQLSMTTHRSPLEEAVTTVAGARTQVGPTRQVLPIPVPHLETEHEIR
jgi:hypothetical protein